MEGPVASTSALINGDSNKSAPKMIPVRLRTTTSQYKIPESQYLVPADWRRYQLSELINKVVGTDAPVPFDFIISDELLRTSLELYQQGKGLTEESVLDIEYVESTLPPQRLSAFQVDDWISDIDSSRPGYFLASSYSSQVHVYSSSAEKLVTLSGMTQSALSTCWLSNTTGNRYDYIAAGGMDRIGRVWRLDRSNIATTARDAFLLPLHTAPISSVRSAGPSANGDRRLLTAGWDGLVALWTLRDGQKEDDAEAIDTDPDNLARKKRRKQNGTSSAPIRKAPTHVFHSHKGAVTRAIFDRQDNNVAYSAGWDHTVKTWDLETGSEASSRSSDKVITDLDQMASKNLLVTGSTDRLVCFWDSREALSTISLTLSGHKSQVSSVRAHPISPLLVVSASFDSTMRIWDARSPKQALFTIQREAKPASADSKPVPGIGDKILSAAWDGQIIASGGEDKQIQLHRTNVNT
ncbi:uncharacterized protein L969DRAFT_90027 [Mixia osmundae IAM 14324]|uniref:Ribosome biogenesis protein YTM1 n=1 Tax=Mixia osmundae (strain CBS 9802 / IAM 14324 / JCM 22182 / KY 12970) TaxID=764103 RepID=G7DUP5_MIXOS|nr:uncharacterized protein L969DRAFT_90027 [Mixia osmundae IAM 14324]KEI37480.1 hypothetical protein L969DRAFT_90027 [Mixia osmundae IAM 14324]GAA94305.1 hypothetical protein E5Q_00954 [Mixia osmundae IAM 14324]